MVALDGDGKSLGIGPYIEYFMRLRVFSSYWVR